MQTSLTESQEIQQVELSIAEARKFLKLVEALERLEQNEDFKVVVFESYFIEEPARLTGLLAEPVMQRDDHQKNLMLTLRGISELRQFLLSTKTKGEQTRYDLQQQLDALDELRSPEQEG